MSKTKKKKVEINKAQSYDTDAVYRAFQEKGFSVSYLKKQDSNVHMASVPVETTNTIQNNAKCERVLDEKKGALTSQSRNRSKDCSFIPPAGGLEPSEELVVCPVCYTFLPSSVVDVKTKSQKSIQQMMVGYCKKCDKYYSDNILAKKLQYTTRTKPKHIIVWSNIRFRCSQNRNNSFPYEFVSLNGKQLSKEHIKAWFDYMKSKSCNKATTKNKPKKKALPSSTFSIKQLVYQLPVLDSNSTKCPYCQREADGFLPITYAAYTASGYSQQYTNVRSCKKCEVIFLEGEQFKQIQYQSKGRYVNSVKIKDYPTPKQLMAAILGEPKSEKFKLSTISLPFADNLSGKVNLSTENKVISIYPQTCHCHTCRDKYGIETIINRTAVVQTVSGEMVDVNVMFCQGCGSYFMNIKSFEQYKKLYGGLLFECKLSSDLNKSQYSWFDFAPDSILSRCGYTVKEGVSKEYRQAILRYILDNHKATKYEIIEHISGFINLKYTLPQYRGACKRWEEDIAFVNSYHIQYQKKVYGLSFVQGRKVK